VSMKLGSVLLSALFLLAAFALAKRAANTWPVELLAKIGKALMEIGQAIFQSAHPLLVLFTFGSALILIFGWSIVVAVLVRFSYVSKTQTPS
jgi:hypothetical protein